MIFVFFTGKPEAIDLIQQMLHINPRKRIRVDQALSHPYFAQLHHPKSEKVIDQSEFNKYTKKNFDSIEKEYNSIFGIRHLMFQTLVDFDPYSKKIKKNRMVKTERASNHRKTGTYQHRKAPPSAPPESC